MSAPCSALVVNMICVCVLLNLVEIQSYEIELPSQASLDGRFLPRRKLRHVWCYNVANFRLVTIHCKYLNAWFECNDIVIPVYSHYPLDLNAKSFDTKGKTFSIRYFCIRIKRVMTVYENYDVIAFKCYIQIFTL